MFAILQGREADFVPIFPKIAFSNVLACHGMTVREYMTDSACMARAVIGAQELFGWDTLAFHTDIGSEGHALGSLYEQPEHGPSQLTKYLLNDIADYEKIVTPDPNVALPMKTVIDAVKIAKREKGSDAFIQAWTNGPLNIASQVLRIDSLLTEMLDNPEALHLLLERCLATGLVYAKALVSAGADAIAFGHAMASSSVISKEHYTEFALPYEKRLVAAIHKEGAVAITHICGNIVPIVGLISENGSDIIDFDHVCDFGTLNQSAPEKIFRGNISPELLAFGTEEQIDENVKRLLMTGGKTRKLILGSGCEIALNTPINNLHAFVKAGRNYGKLS